MVLEACMTKLLGVPTVLGTEHLEQELSALDPLESSELCLLFIVNALLVDLGKLFKRDARFGQRLGEKANQIDLHYNILTQDFDPL